MSFIAPQMLKVIIIYRKTQLFTTKTYIQQSISNNETITSRNKQTIPFVSFYAS